jgi:hypothetical protein
MLTETQRELHTALFDGLTVLSSVEPSTPLRLDPERGRGVEGGNRKNAMRDGHAEF